MDPILDEPGSLDPQIPVDEEGRYTSFTITDDAQAAWAMRKLLQFEQEADEARRLAEAEKDRIETWLERQLSRHQHDRDYFRSILTHYAIGQRAEKDRKTIDTPYGSVKSRAGQPKITVSDLPAFLEWAKQDKPEFVRIKEDIDLTKVKAACQIENTPTLGLVAVTDDGEIVPGLNIDPATVNITIEVTK